MKKPQCSPRRNVGRPRKQKEALEPSLLVTTIRHVDDDGNVTRLTFGELKTLIRQQRNEEARMSRERRAEVLRMVREDRAARTSFLKEEREAERRIKSFWASLRVRVREPRKKPDRQGRRFELEIRRPRPRGLPTYSKDIIDAFGRRGIYYRARYVSAREGASYLGCAKAVWRYMVREGAVELDSLGVPSVLSNMGQDGLEVGACCDLLESVQRAERSNAKLFTTIEVNLPHDLSPEARLVLLHRFCEEAFGAFDLPYAAVVHNPPEGGDQRNTHAHIMVWWRPVIRTAPYEWQVAKDLATEHDSIEMTKVQRELFAGAMTWASQAEGKKRVYTGLSHAERGLAILPTVKIGKDMVELHRRGERVALIERNADIIRRNEALIAADQLRDGIARAEAIRRELHDFGRSRANPVRPTACKHSEPAPFAKTVAQSAPTERRRAASIGAGPESIPAAVARMVPESLVGERKAAQAFLPRRDGVAAMPKAAKLVATSVGEAGASGRKARGRGIGFAMVERVPKPVRAITKSTTQLTHQAWTRAEMVETQSTVFASQALGALKGSPASLPLPAKKPAQRPPRPLLPFQTCTVFGPSPDIPVIPGARKTSNRLAPLACPAKLVASKPVVDLPLSAMIPLQSPTASAIQSATARDVETALAASSALTAALPTPLTLLTRHHSAATTRAVRGYQPLPCPPAASKVDHFDEIWTMLWKAQRKKEELRVSAAPPAKSAIPSLQAPPDPRPAVRLKKRDPKDPRRLSAPLVDHLVDVALHPEWVQVERKRIRFVGGSALFNERRRIWQGDQEVLRLIAQVHRHATGGPDMVPQHLRRQINEAIALQQGQSAGLRPGGRAEGMDGIDL